jgi:hypothetical protein
MPDKAKSVMTEQLTVAMSTMEMAATADARLSPVTHALGSLVCAQRHSMTFMTITILNVRMRIMLMEMDAAQHLLLSSDTNAMEVVPSKRTFATRYVVMESTWRVGGATMEITRPVMAVTLDAMLREDGPAWEDPQHLETSALRNVEIQLILAFTNVMMATTSVEMVAAQLAQSRLGLSAWEEITT